jgi:hypothetical protein
MEEAEIIQYRILAQSVGLCRQITHGIMEYCKNGILGIKSGPPQVDYFWLCAIHIKTDLIPPNLAFLPREIIFSHFTGANIPIFPGPDRFNINRILAIFA